MSEFSLLLRTVRHLQPSQVAHRARLRVQRSRLARDPQRHERRLQTSVTTWTGMPEGFVALDRRLLTGFPSPEANAAGWFEFLAQASDLGQPVNWTPEWATQLWRYHLHYFEWAYAFASHPDEEWARAAFVDLWRSWTAGTTFGRWDEWSPYVASLRTWVLCDVFEPLVARSRFERDMAQAIALHAQYVLANMELDVGGNHLIKNAKALIGGGVFLGDVSMVETGCAHIARQIGVQILGDGGHFERSPAYHAQVLGDFVDIEGVLRGAKLPPIDGLSEAIGRMRSWLASMCHPDGDVALFNDSGLVGADRLSALGVSTMSERLTVLADTGYVVIRPDERSALFVDAGDPCPDELPAHAHSDCLSFELSVDGTRVIVDTGTSTYAPGERRQYERSTVAHNTIGLDDIDQTEVWGTFRAAFRARGSIEKVVERPDGVSVTATHNGYRRLRGKVTHRRRFDVTADEVVIGDRVEGSGSHTLTWSLHVAPGIDVVQVRPDRIVAGPVDIDITAAGMPVFVQVEPALVATGFNCAEWGTALRIQAEVELPVEVSARIVVRALRDAGPCDDAVAEACDG
ncbi:MAG: heparinase II/III family protein [Acidimicrobiia bacterium]